MNIFDIEQNESTLLIKLTEPYLNHKDGVSSFVSLAFYESLKYHCENFAKLYYVNEPIVIDNVDSVKIYATNKKMLKELTTIFSNTNKASNLYEIFDKHLNKYTIDSIHNFFSNIIWEEIIDFNRHKKLNFITSANEDSAISIKFTSAALEHLDTEKNVEFIGSFLDALMEKLMFLGKNYYPKTEFLIERSKVISNDQHFLQYIAHLIDKVNSQSNHIYEMSYSQKGEYYPMRDEFYDFFCGFMEKQILEDKLVVNPESQKKKPKI
jgi:hypothetical protein